MCQLPGPHHLAAFMPAPVMLQLPGPHHLAAFMPAPPLLQLPGLYACCLYACCYSFRARTTSLPSRLPLPCCSYQARTSSLEHDLIVSLPVLSCPPTLSNEQVVTLLSHFLSCRDKRRWQGRQHHR